ncbi:hypothetical protein FACS189437_02540 [Bacteroidia bacterium]|nr:hypothetical protein FACS189437_02540 [Bacteroidia bacterium]
MKKLSLLIVITLISHCMMAQSAVCDKLLQDGQNAYNSGNYTQAKEYFNKGLESHLGCNTTDFQNWIKQCDEKISKAASTEKPITFKELGSLIVFPKDIEIMQSNYADAVNMCKTLGNVFGHSNWRLPTKQELTLMYMNRGKIKGLKPAGKYISMEGFLDFKKGSFHSEEDWQNQECYLRPVYTVKSPYYINNLPLTLNFDAIGEEKNIDVDSNNDDWKLENSLSWCKISKNKSSLNIICDINNEGMDRSGLVFVIAVDNKRDSILIFQKGAKLEISQLEINMKPKTDESAIIEINANLPWKILDFPDWCVITTLEQYLTIKCKMNVGKERLGHITVMSGNLTKKVVVTQGGTVSSVFKTIKKGVDNVKNINK